MLLSAVCTVQMGYTPRGRLDPVAHGGVPALQLRDLSADGAVTRPLAQYQLGRGVERYLVGPGDVIFRSRGERNTATALAEDFAVPAVAVLPLIVLRPNSDLVDPRYLAWALNQEPAQRHFDQAAQGQTIRMVPKSSLDNLDIHLPDLATQRLIVAIDDLAAREAALTSRLAESRRKMMSALLVERIGQNDNGRRAA